MFKSRSYTKELLDNPSIPDSDLFVNLKELHFINKWLGGYKITFNALKKLQLNSSTTIVDIGSGGGDTLKEIYKWGIKHKLNLNLFGIDIKPACIHYSLANDSNKAISFICDDYKNIFNHLPKVDIIHSCLFCHHLSNNEIIELINFAVNNNTILVINDLQRNPIAYYSIKILTKLFSKSYLVKNDAPLSVLRGFKKKEWENILQQSKAKVYSIKYKWAFRYQIIIHAN